MKSILRLGWERFNLVASIMGETQGRVIVIAFYFTILMPFGILSRIFSDPLRLRNKPNRELLWLERQSVSEDLDSARQQG